MSKNPFKLDEREMITFRKISATLYAITLYALFGIIVYRQFVLKQPSQEWDDIAILATLNVIILLGASLYLNGTINPAKVKLSRLLIGYAIFVLLGLAFTVFKYSVLLDEVISMVEIWDYFFIVLKVSGILALGWGSLAFLGNRKMEKKLEE